jgi:hypothetical protein
LCSIGDGLEIVDGERDLTASASGLLRTRLAERLSSRRAEIEHATLTRVYGISDPAEVEDPNYTTGLREAVAAALEYGLAAIEGPATWAPVPVQLLFQARYAARSGVSLDTVLRRYFAGFSLLGDFIVQEANAKIAIPAAELQRAMRGEAAVFDRLVVSVAEEYMRESESRHHRSAEENRAAQVRMLLDGEMVDAPELGYDLDAWHIGAIAIGPGARDAMRDVAKRLDRRPLVVCVGQGTVWGWLGGKRKLASNEVLRLAESRWPAAAILALGEPGLGIEGWHLTHRQARAALPIASRGSRRLVGYAEVALLASALGDEVLASSLRDAFLAPLESYRDRGATARETLDAYFVAGRNISSAAAALGVSRKTVSSRLHSIEDRLGRSLHRCGAELETALRLRTLTVTQNES